MLRLLREQGTNTHNLHQSFFHFFATEKSPSFPEFISWCADKYSISERVIMDVTGSTVLYPISSLAIRKSLSIPNEFSLKSQDYSEESILQYFKESPIERKKDFLRKCLKPYANLLDNSFPLYSNMFNEET